MKPDGGPAFPETHTVGRYDTYEGFIPGWQGRSGMSLRDYFAAQYLCGFSARQPSDYPLTPEEKAAWAYIHADAMLAERDK